MSSKPRMSGTLLMLVLGVFCGCQTTAVMEAPRPNTIAVWDFENLNPSELAGFNLGELLAAKTMEVFQKSDDWIMVERQELILALEEQHLGSSDVVDEATRLNIGRVLGANTMVFGSYMKFMENLNVNLRMVDVATGRVIKAAQKTVPFTTVSGALETARQVALEIQK